MAKRTYGQGRIFLRGKKYWVSICVDGKEQRHPTHSESRKEAERLLAKLLGQKVRNELMPVNAYPTLSEILDEYMDRATKRMQEASESQRRRGMSPKTFYAYSYQIDKHLKPFFGRLLITQLTTDKITDYRELRESQPVDQGNNAKPGTLRKTARLVGYTTINRELAVLRAAIRDLQKRRPSAVPSVPYFPMESERDNIRQGFLTDDQFEHLYGFLPLHLRALAACAFVIGGRKGEWLDCDWEWVDFAAAEIRFPKTKNRKARVVPIIPGLMADALLEAKRIRDATYPELPAVFQYQGKRLTTFRTAWDTATKRAGFSGMHFHDMRRSASMGMRKAGVPSSLRMKVMGHETDEMDRRYDIGDIEDIRFVRDKMTEHRKKRLPVN